LRNEGKPKKEGKIIIEIIIQIFADMAAKHYN
jgi:hypothetical protein